MDPTHLSGWRIAFWISLLLSFLSAFLSTSVHAQDAQSLVRDLQNQSTRPTALEKLDWMLPPA